MWIGHCPLSAGTASSTARSGHFRFGLECGLLLSPRESLVPEFVPAINAAIMPVDVEAAAAPPVAQVAAEPVEMRAATVPVIASLPAATAPVKTAPAAAATPAASVPAPAMATIPPRRLESAVFVAPAALRLEDVAPVAPAAASRIFEPVAVDPVELLSPVEVADAEADGSAAEPLALAAATAAPAMYTPVAAPSGGLVAELPAVEWPVAKPPAIAPAPFIAPAPVAATPPAGAPVAAPVPTPPVQLAIVPQEPAPQQPAPQQPVPHQSVRPFARPFLRDPAARSPALRSRQPPGDVAAELPVQASAAVTPPRPTSGSMPSAASPPSDAGPASKAPGTAASLATVADELGGEGTPVFQIRWDRAPGTTSRTREVPEKADRPATREGDAGLFRRL